MRLLILQELIVKPLSSTVMIVGRRKSKIGVSLIVKCFVHVECDVEYADPPNRQVISNIMMVHFVAWNSPKQVIHISQGTILYYLCIF